MRQAAWLAAGCGLLAWLATGSQAGDPPKASPHEAVVVQMLGSLDQMTKALVMVKDGPSGEAARPQLKQAAKQFVDIREKAEQLKPPSLQEKERIVEKYQKKLAESVQELRNEMRRVQGVPGGPEVLKELQEVFKTPKKK